MEEGKTLTESELPVVAVRLVRDRGLYSEQRISKPEDAVRLMAAMMCELDREMLAVLNLDTKGRPINCNVVSIGSLNFSIAEPREILKSAILSNAASIVLVHNHPSGELTPSKEDTEMTSRMIRVCSDIGIPLWDHIIVGTNDREWFSLCEKKIIESLKEECEVCEETDYTQLEFEKKSRKKRSRNAREER